MSSIHKEIRAALEVHLNSLSGVPQIAWENTTFVPTTGTPWLSLRYTPLRRFPAVRGINPQQRYEGLFSMELKYPEGSGPSAADDMADSILEHFEATSTISGSGFNITVETSDRGQGTDDSPWYSVPITINWYTYKV